MTRATPILRQPYRRRSNAEWDEIRRLYQAGGTAKALMKEYGGTERTLYSRARRDGWLRKDDPEAAPPEAGLTPIQADAAVRRLGGGRCAGLGGDGADAGAGRAGAVGADAVGGGLYPAGRLSADAARRAPPGSFGGAATD